MAKNELDFALGIYKCKGNINHLRVRVRLEVAKTSVIPLSNTEEQETGLEQQSSEVEEKEISWQEKIFSCYELKYYTDEANISSPVDQEYHEQTTRILSANPQGPNNRIFTRTAREDVSDSVRKEIIFGGKNYPIHRLQSLDISNEIELEEPALSPRNIVEYNPSKEFQKRSRSILASTQTMHVLADLSDANHNSCTNHILVTLKWDMKSSTLLVSPDFTSPNSVGYKIDTNTIRDTRYEYRYWTEIVSPKDDYEPSSSRKVPWKIPAYHQYFRNITEFAVPTRNEMDVHIFGEIQKATGFEYSLLFIQYFVHLPETWSSDSHLSGVTQMCYINDDDAAVFSHPLDVKLTLHLASYKIHVEDTDANSSEHLSNSDAMENMRNFEAPQIVFEVCSLDKSGRYRTEGYGSVYVPTAAGCHDVSIKMWRPAPRSKIEEMRHFFIGSTLQLEDSLYCGVLRNKDRLLSRYGFCTVPSGSVQLKMHIVTHKRRDSGSPLLQTRRYSMLTQHFSTSVVVNSISKILEAFKRARERMLLAREPILH